MKKTSKILISVILCLTVAFCSLIPAFATEPKTAFIVVSGMNTFPLYKDGEKVFPTTAKTIAKLASKIILPLVYHNGSFSAERRQLSRQLYE